MERREFLNRLAQAGMAGLVATGASPAMASFMRQGAASGSISAKDNYTSAPVDVFTEDFRRLVAWTAETILPATDTPGAIDARVHKFVELIVRDWMTIEEREAFLSGFKEIDARANVHHGKTFADCSEEERTVLLEGLEDEQKDHPWFATGYTDGFTSDAPFMAQLKEIVVTGFFMSDIGANHVLRPNHFPGYLEGDIPIDPEDSAWTTMPRM